MYTSKCKCKHEKEEYMCLPSFLAHSFLEERAVSCANPLLSVENFKGTKAVVHNFKPSLYSFIVGQSPVLIDGSQRITDGGKHWRQISGAG